MLVSFVDGHEGGVGLVLPVERARAHHLLVHEGGLARCACTLGALVVHLVQAELLTETSTKVLSYIFQM